MFADVDIDDYASAPLITSSTGALAFAIMRFWRDVHRLLNAAQPAEKIIEQILKLVGLSMGADRAYTFSVTGNRMFSSCTCEWTRSPAYVLRPLLQNIDQRGLDGWLRRFDENNFIGIENTDSPQPGLEKPAAKFKRDLIKSIYVFGFRDEGRLIGYFGLDYVGTSWKMDELTKQVMHQFASTLNFYIMRHETLELWKQTMNAMPAAMFIKSVDNDLRYIYANPKYRQLYGEDVVGSTDEEIFGQQHGQAFRDQDMECLRTRKPFKIDGPQYDYSNVAKGYYSTIKFPVSTKIGRHYMAGFISDISAEHDLRMQALDLLDKAKVAERSKSLFLAAMSHEIRTPLNAIIGLLDELGHDDIPDETRAEYIASATDASRALLALINDVLDISKIESGQMHMNPVETDLESVLRECESIFTESCRGKGLVYRSVIAADLPILLIDNSRLRQILFNLIGNAVKFTEHGGVTVSGEFVRASDTSGTLTLKVADTGIGIDAADHQKVFELFEQASHIRGTSMANKGTGLGLCLCKHLAKRLNGDITLESRPGEGTTFSVTLRELPYVERERSEFAAPKLERRQTDLSIIARTARVLIVDDVPMNLKVLGIILRRMKVESVPAKNAAEALAILKRESFTHVLTDIWMPETNGEQLARTIRANPEWAHLKIAAQTADVEASNNFETSIFDAVLSKPLTPEKIDAFLRNN